jgi:Plant mobile domain
MSVCPLIFWDVVEMHYPNRVSRQFGIRQCMPQPSDLDKKADDLHKISRGKSHGVAWPTRHASWITMWHNRNQSRINGTPADGVAATDIGYLQWYRSFTLPQVNPVERHAGSGYQPSDVGSDRAMVSVSLSLHDFMNFHFEVSSDI